MNLVSCLSFLPRQSFIRYRLVRYMASSGAGTPVSDAIRQKLMEGFAGGSFLHLDVVNDSHKHNVPEGSESHFNVLVVTDAFEGKMSAVRLNTRNLSLLLSIRC